MILPATSSTTITQKLETKTVAYAATQAFLFVDPDRVIEVEPRPLPCGVKGDLTAGEAGT